MYKFIFVFLVLSLEANALVVSKKETSSCPVAIHCEASKDKLLLVEMTWTTQVDIDLSISTPDGEYSFENRELNGSSARLVKDDRGGASSNSALESWRSYEPTIGDYEVCVFYYHGTGETSVETTLLKNSGSELVSVKLAKSGDKVCPIKFKVLDNFEVQMERP